MGVTSKKLTQASVWRVLTEETEIKRQAGGQRSTPGNGSPESCKVATSLLCRPSIPKTAQAHDPPQQASGSQLTEIHSGGPVRLSFSQKHICVSQDFPHIHQPKQHYQDRLPVEADLRTQLSSIKPDIRETCKHVKQRHFSCDICCLLWKKQLFFMKKVLFMLTYKRFIIAILK